MLDPPSDLEGGGKGFDTGVLTLALTLTFGLGGLGFFGGEETAFAPDFFLPLGFRELVSESESENEWIS